MIHSELEQPTWLGVGNQRAQSSLSLCKKPFLLKSLQLLIVFSGDLSSDRDDHLEHYLCHMVVATLVHRESPSESR